MRGREPVRVFVSYAAEDRAFFEAFEKHLSVLRRRGLVDVWHEGQLLAGTTFVATTRAQIDQADVVVLLVSPDFVASERCWEEQLGRALERHARGQVTLVPIRIRALFSEGSPFERLQALPRDGSVIGDPSNDEAWREITEDIARRPARATGPRPGAEGWEDETAWERAWHRAKLGDRPDDFRARVERLCHLREKKRLVRCRAPAPFAGVWEIETSADPIEVKPVAALDGLPTVEAVRAFDELLDERYRGEDPTIRSMLVYRGERGTKAPDAVVRDARQRGIILTAVDTLNRLIDFDAYLERLHHKLAHDPVYPQDLYIEQRGHHVAGKAGRDVPNALDEVWNLVTDERQPRFLLVLADFGTGKTFLLRQLAARLARPKSDVVPILVELRALEKARSLDVLLTQHFTLAGERSFDLDAFYHMLEQGRIALLFDGFDELVPRVTFDRAAEHLETLIEAARGKAKVVITSRTQHFLTDKEVEQALARRADRVPHRQMFKLLPFRDDEIRAFLVRKLGSEEAADRRFALLGQVTDLLGLSRNPRMLSFIVEIDEQKLLEARDRKGQITKTALYTLLVERWIKYEFKRSEYKGVPTLLDPPDRWRAVLALAERMWGSGDKGVDLREMPEGLRDELVKLGPPDQDAHTKFQHAASGTLLVRDEDGRFAFLHRSILELAAAWAAALALRLGRPDSRLLAGTEMTDLMAEFFGDLATPEKAVPWAQGALASEATTATKKNARRVLDRLPPEVRARLTRARVVRRDEVIRGESFAGQDLQGADFSGSDLSEAIFTGADLTGAKLVRARLVQADLDHATLANADLRGTNLSFARLSGADLRGAKLEGAVFRYARLSGAKLDAGAIESLDALAACPPRPLQVHSTTLPALRACNAVAVSPDGTLIVSGYADGTLVIWRLATGQPLRVWGAHEDDVRSVAFSPDGLFFASASDDKSIRLWAVADGTSLLTLQGLSSSAWSVAFSPDGLSLAAAFDDGFVRLWRVADDASSIVLEGHSRHVRSVAFSPDGLSLAAAFDDGSVRLWRIADGASLLTLQGHSGPVFRVAFSPNGRSLVSASGDDSVRLWRVADGAPLLTLQGRAGPVFSIAFSPDGRSLASASHDGTVRLWRVADGTSLLTLQGHPGSVSAVAFSPDGCFLVSSCSGGSIRVWRVADGACLLTLLGHSGSVSSVAFSPDGRSLASASSDDSVRLWSLANDTSLRTVQGHFFSVSSVAFSPDGRSLASASFDNSVRLWRVADGAPLLTLRGHASSVRSVVFSPDGRYVASASNDCSVRLWRVADGTCRLTLRGHANSVLSVAFSPDGRLLASASADTSVRLWRVADGTCRLTLRGHILADLSVAFSPDGRSLASGSDDTSVRLWRVTDGTCRLTLKGHSGAVWSVAFSPDGRSLASASSDHSVRLWRVANGAPLLVLQGHASAVRSVTFSPDGRSLASASFDNTIRLWRVADGQCLAVLYATATGWVAFTPEGRYKLSGDLQGTFWHLIGLCRFEPGELDEAFPDLRMKDDEPLFTLEPPAPALRPWAPPSGPRRLR